MTFTFKVVELGSILDQAKAKAFWERECSKVFRENERLTRENEISAATVDKLGQDLCDAKEALEKARREAAWLELKLQAAEAAPALEILQKIRKNLEAEGMIKPGDSLRWTVAEIAKDLKGERQIAAMRFGEISILKLRLHQIGNIVDER